MSSNPLNSTDQHYLPVTLVEVWFEQLFKTIFYRLEIKLSVFETR